MRLKKALAITLAMVFAVSLSACGKDEFKDVYDYKLNDYVQLGDYIGINYIPTTVNDITDDSVMTQIYSNIEKKDLMIKNDITDRPAEAGDTVNIDFEGLIDGVAFDGGTSKGYELLLGSGSFIDGFEDGLIGAKNGQVLSLDLKFPDNYHSADLAGKPVVFNVTVNSIYTKSYPELTDELVAQLSDYSTVDDYKTYIKNSLESSQKINAENTDKSNVWNSICEKSTVKNIPETERTTYFNNYYSYYENYAKSMNITLEQFAKANNYTLDQFTQECNSVAEESVKNDIIALAIYRDADLKMAEDEYNTYKEDLISTMNCTTEDDAIKLMGNEELFKTQIIYFYVIDYLMNNAVAVQS